MFTNSSKSKRNQDKIIHEAIEELASGYSSYRIEEITEELIQIGEPAIPSLLMACKSAFLNCRQYAPLILGEIWLKAKSKKALHALVEALKYPDADKSAFAVLFEIREQSIIPELFNIIWKVRPWNRESVAKLVFEFGTEEQIKRMELALKKVERLPDPGLPEDYPIK